MISHYKWLTLLTEQSTAGHLTPVRNALHHGFGDADVQLAASKVVEEEEWFRSMSEDIIDTHCHQVYAHSVMYITCLRYLQGKILHEWGHHWHISPPGLCPQCYIYITYLRYLQGKILHERTSLTHIVTRSMPTVLCILHVCAIFKVKYSKLYLHFIQ